MRSHREYPKIGLRREKIIRHRGKEHPSFPLLRMAMWKQACFIHQPQEDILKGYRSWLSSQLLIPIWSILLLLLFKSVEHYNLTAHPTCSRNLETLQIFFSWIGTWLLLQFCSVPLLAWCQQQSHWTFDAFDIKPQFYGPSNPPTAYILHPPYSHSTCYHLSDSPFVNKPTHIIGGFCSFSSGQCTFSRLAHIIKSGKGIKSYT